MLLKLILLELVWQNRKFISSWPPTEARLAGFEDRRLSLFCPFVYYHIKGIHSHRWRELNKNMLCETILLKLDPFVGLIKKPPGSEYFVKFNMQLRILQTNGFCSSKWHFISKQIFLQSPLSHVIFPLSTWKKGFF